MVEINQIKEMNDFYAENYKTTKDWWKTLEKIEINGKLLYVYGVEEFLLLKYPFWRSSAIPINTSVSLFTGKEKIPS